MTMYRIKRGESLPLCYSVAGKNDLSDFEARVFVMRDLENSPEIDTGLSLSDDNSEMTGMLTSDQTRQLDLRMYWLVCVFKSGDENIQIHDKLIVEQDYFYNPA